MSREETPGLNWSADRLLPQFQAPQHLTVYDVRHASSDGLLSISTLTGLINRPQPQVYLLGSDDDAYWLQELAGSVPHETASASNDSALEAMLAAFPGCAKGLIIYDPAFQDSLNIATIMAGQQDGVVVSPNQATTLHTTHNLPILADLRTFHWQQPIEAYEWARQNLLKDASTRIIAGLAPRVRGGLRAFLVATRAFIYWLDSRDFLPNPSENWQSQRPLMQKILSSFTGQAVHLGWFIDEASGVSLTSAEAIPVLATDWMTNLEVWTSIAASHPPTRPASLPPSKETADNKIYLSFTISDGDNFQYLQHRMLQLWRDPARGTIPLGWTFSPLLAESVPAMNSYYFNTATPTDELIAGPNGAGYFYPSRWPADQLPAFWQRSGQLMKTLGMTDIEVLDVDFLQGAGVPVLSRLLLIGLGIHDNALQEQAVKELAPFGVTGILSGTGLPRPTWNIIDAIPVYQNLGIAISISEAINLIRFASLTFFQRPLFFNVYVLAWNMTPSDIKQVIEQLGSDYEVVTPGTLLSLLAKTKA